MNANPKPGLIQEILSRMDSEDWENFLIMLMFMLAGVVIAAAFAAGMAVGYWLA